MRTLVAAIYDDLDNVAGIKTEAQTSVTIGWNGEWYELDLTTQHAADVADAFTLYRKVGRKLSSPPRPRRTHRSDVSLADARRHGKAMRKFADASKGRYTYVTYPRKDGHSTTYAYPDELRRAYAAAHLATEGTTSG